MTIVRSRGEPISHLLGIERGIDEVVPRPVPVHGAGGPRVGQRDLPMGFKDGEARQPSRRAALLPGIAAVVAPPRQGADGHVKVAHRGSRRRFGVATAGVVPRTAQHDGVPLGPVPPHQTPLQAVGEHLESGPDPPPPFVRMQGRRHGIAVPVPVLVPASVVFPFERTSQPLRGFPRPELGVVPIGVDDVPVSRAHHLGGREGQVGATGAAVPDRIVDAEDEGEAGVALRGGEGEAVVPPLHEAAGLGPAGSAGAAGAKAKARPPADPIALPLPLPAVVGRVGGEEVPAGVRRLLRVGRPAAVLRRLR